MNVLKRIGIMSILVISHSIQSMDELDMKQLSPIEKQLVLRAVAMSGKDIVERKILKQRYDGEMQFDARNHIFHCSTPSILKVEVTVSQNEIEKDLLARNIFQKIAEIEQESGYHPKSEIFMQNGIQVAGPTNRLGNNTRYYWVKEGVVEVKAHFESSTREALLATIQ